MSETVGRPHPRRPPASYQDPVALHNGRLEGGTDQSSPLERGEV